MAPYQTLYDSPAGPLLLSSDGERLTGLSFAPAGMLSAGQAALPVFQQAAQWLDLYFSGREPLCSVPLAPAGSAFQKEVWAMLRELPYGQTVSYGALAGMLAEKRGLARLSPRAVGAALGRNPILLLIPCHRVLGAGGRLTGYAGGLAKKAFLLRLEGSLPPGVDAL